MFVQILLHTTLSRSNLSQGLQFAYQDNSVTVVQKQHVVLFSSLLGFHNRAVESLMSHKISFISGNNGLHLAEKKAK